MEEITRKARRDCAVPGCGRGATAPHDLDLCEKHLTCPRCGSGIHVFRRLVLDCCSLHIAVANRQAWKIPWIQWLRTAETSAYFQHRIKRARIFVGKYSAIAGLPIPVEV
jgi:hypothetical protein